jgi:hypothetical protein
MIDVETLRKLLRYEPETGKLFWLPRPREMFKSQRAYSTWNSRFAGKTALSSKHAHGYLIGPVLGKMRKAHRVAWALETGQWPVGDLDHINGCRADNRFANLREATRSENMFNCKSHRDSTSRFRGVSWNEADKRWVVGVSVNGRRKHIGRYADEVDAAKAFNDAATKYYGQFARLNPV